MRCVSLAWPLPVGRLSTMNNFSQGDNLSGPNVWYQEFYSRSLSDKQRAIFVSAKAVSFSSSASTKVRFILIAFRVPLHLNSEPCLSSILWIRTPLKRSGMFLRDPVSSVAASLIGCVSQDRPKIITFYFETFRKKTLNVSNYVKFSFFEACRDSEFIVERRASERGLWRLSVVI